MRPQRSGYVSMVWPGMNQVAWMLWLASNARMRSAPTAPNSPCEIGVGEVIPRASQSESASKSNVRQTRWRDMVDSPLCLRGLQAEQRTTSARHAALLDQHLEAAEARRVKESRKGVTLRHTPQLV